MLRSREALIAEVWGGLMLSRYVGLVVGRPWLIVIAVSLFLAICGAFASTVAVRSASESAYPTNSDLTRQIEAVKRIYDSNNTLLFTVAAADTSKALAELCRLTSTLETIPEITPGSVSSIVAPSAKLVSSTTDDFVVRPGSSTCDQASSPTTSDLEQLGPQKDVLITRTGAYLVFADVNLSEDSLPAFLAKTIDPLVASAPAGVSVSVTGGVEFLAALQTYSARISLYLPFVILIIGALHFEALRSWQAVIIPLLTGILATVVMLGVAGALGLSLDEYSSTAPILIIAVAAGHSVQLLKRYMEEINQGAGAKPIDRAASRAAVAATLIAMTPVLATAVVSASLCLLSLALLDIPAIARFGILSASGLLAALVLELSLVPAIRVLLPPPKARASFGDLSRHWGRVVSGLQAASQKTSARVMGAIIVLTIGFLAIGVARVMPSHSLTQTFAPSTPERRELSKAVAQGAGPFVMDLVIDSGEPQGAFNANIIEAARDIGEQVRRDPNVTAVASPVDIMTFLKCAFVHAGNCAEARIETREEASQIWTLLYGDDVRSTFIDESARYLRLRVMLAADESRFITVIHDKAEQIASAHHVTLLSGGYATVVKALGEGIIEAAKLKVAIILLVVALTGFVVFRSAWAALLVVIPSALTALASYAFLGWTGTPLNVATAMIAALAVGVGTDYLIYFTFRLREALLRTSDWDTAVTAAYRSAGGASLCVMTAVAGGYLVLLASSDFRVHQWLGTFIPLAMLVSLVGALVVYPFALRIIRPAYIFPQRGRAQPSSSVTTASVNPSDAATETT